MKPIVKQLIVAALVLVFVTVASLGIRRVRFGANQSESVESPVVTEIEPAEAEEVDAEPEPEYADEPEPEEPSEDYSEAKSSKGDYAKAKGKGAGGLQKISLSENENLYITAKGETWYTGQGPDGKPTKMRVQIDEASGEMTVIGGVKSGGPQKISMGDGYDMYVTQEGQTWYVGDGSKSRVEVDDNTGEVTVLEQYGGDDDK